MAIIWRDMHLKVCKQPAVMSVIKNKVEDQDACMDYKKEGQVEHGLWVPKQMEKL